MILANNGKIFMVNRVLLEVFLVFAPGGAARISPAHRPRYTPQIFHIILITTHIYSIKRLSQINADYF